MGREHLQENRVVDVLASKVPCKTTNNQQFSHFNPYQWLYSVAMLPAFWEPSTGPPLGVFQDGWHNLVKTSYFYFKGSKIQIFPDFWQLFLFLFSKVIQNDFPWLQDDWKMTCKQKNPLWMTFENKNWKSCQKSRKIWIFEPLK